MRPRTTKAWTVTILALSLLAALGTWTAKAAVDRLKANRTRSHIQTAVVRAEIETRTDADFDRLRGVPGAGVSIVDLDGAGTMLLCSAACRGWPPTNRVDIDVAPDGKTFAVRTKTTRAACHALDGQEVDRNWTGGTEPPNAGRPRFFMRCGPDGKTVEARGLT